MSLITHMCSRKQVFRSKADALKEIERLVAHGQLRKWIHYYPCPLNYTDYHIGQISYSKKSMKAR